MFEVQISVFQFLLDSKNVREFCQVSQGNQEVIREFHNSNPLVTFPSGRRGGRECPPPVAPLLVSMLSKTKRILCMMFSSFSRSP